MLAQKVRGLYLYGSAVDGELRPNSDLDLLAVVERPTTTAEKRAVVDELRPISSRFERPAGWRPVELTIVVESQVRPWRYPPMMDLQLGEWLRTALDAGELSRSAPNPDLTLLIAMARAHSRPVIGPPATELLDPVPAEDVRRAVADTTPGILADIDSDTTNVLLTLARGWYTLATGGFASKESAANWAIPRIGPDDRPSLVRARDVYLGAAADDWTELVKSAETTARALLERVQSAA